MWQWVSAVVRQKLPLQSLENSALVRRLHFTALFGKDDVPQIEQLNNETP
jgi:hypothetical protein